LVHAKDIVREIRGLLVEADNIALSADDILERLPSRDSLIAEAGSRAHALERLRDLLVLDVGTQVRFEYVQEKLPPSDGAPGRITRRIRPVYALVR
jgi:hypothetical protein